MRVLELLNDNPKKYAKRFYQNIYEEGYDVVEGVYTRSKDYITLKHLECGEIYPVRPDNFNQGNRCPRCSDEKSRINRKKPHMERFYNLIEQEGYELADGSYYINTYTHVYLRHKKCGNEFSVTPNNFIKEAGTRCPKCSIQIRSDKRRKTQDDFEQEVYSLVGDEYIVLGDYRTTHKPVLMRHNSESCGYYEWDVSPNMFLHRERRCPKCEGRVRWNTNLFKAEVSRITNDEYTLLGEYVDISTPILMRHNSDCCGHNEYLVSPDGFNQGTRCPVCKSSRGEALIANYLYRLKIPFTTQQTFDRCKIKRKLPFDTYINNTLIIHTSMCLSKQGSNSIFFQIINIVKPKITINLRNATLNTKKWPFLGRLPPWAYHTFKKIGICMFYSSFSA